MGAASAPPRTIPPSASTAKTLILVGIILQALEVLIVLGLGAVFLIVFIGVFFILVGILGIIWLLLVYVLSYQRVTEGRYEPARTPTLVVAILSLLTINLISGILYLIAYVKLGDAVREAAANPLASAPPAFAPSSLTKVCLGCGTVLPSPTPKFCPSCGKQVPA